MRWPRKTITAIVLSFCIVAAGAIVIAHSEAGNTPVPGSTDDPLVTKSYVDQKIQAALSSQSGSTGSTTQTGGFQVVQVPAGKKVVPATAAGLEVIVRTGTVDAVAGQGGGIADLTNGSDLSSGQIGLNHYLLLARNDGRGILVDPKSPTCFMVIRGAYLLQ